VTVTSNGRVPGPHPAPHEMTADEARDRVIVTAEALMTELARGEAPALLDVRWTLAARDGRPSFVAGHLPGAVYVDLDTELASPPSPEAGRHPLPTLDALRASAVRWGLRAGQKVVVYDDAGGTSAARAWWLLRWGGVSSVRILDGGLRAWIEAGGGLERGEVAVPPGDVTLTGGRLPIIGIDEVAWWPKRGALLDARAGERFRGEVEPVDARAGRIPGSISAPATENLTPDGRFRSAAELRERFTALGVARASYSAAYCGSGVTACHLIAALASIGQPAVLYPGSWSQWAADPERPIATGPAPAVGSAGDEVGASEAGDQQ
jgi:thiosulfate/3-mercaptopyruvate sulfurtransferase